MGEKFVLTSPTIPEDPMEGVEDTLFKNEQNRLACSKCSEEVTPEVPKDIVILTCRHAVHYDCIVDPHKRCPICSPADGLEAPGPSDAQKKRSREDSEGIELDVSTEKSTSKKAKQSKKSVDRNNSSTMKRLIKELSTADPVNEEILQFKHTSETNTDSNIFLNLYNKIVAGDKKSTQEVLRYYFKEALTNGMIIIEHWLNL